MRLNRQMLMTVVHGVAEGVPGPMDHGVPVVATPVAVDLPVAVGTPAVVAMPAVVVTIARSDQSEISLPRFTRHTNAVGAAVVVALPVAGAVTWDLRGAAVAESFTAPWVAWVRPEVCLRSTSDLQPGR